MLKFVLNRSMLRNRGFLFHALDNSLFVWTAEKMTSKVTNVQSKELSYSNIISVREMNTKSQIRQNYHEESEDAVNKQINLELNASYIYMSMACYFDRDDVALLRASCYFKKNSDEEREHAVKLMKFQNLRGGTVILNDIKAPDKNKWESALEAMEDALELEKKLNQAVLDLHKIACKHEDTQMADFLEREFLHVQVEDIKNFGNYVTNLKRVGPGLGEYYFDREFKT